jgi:hypothetical protein
MSARRHSDGGGRRTGGNWRTLKTRQSLQRPLGAGSSRLSSNPIGRSAHAGPAVRHHVETTGKGEGPSWPDIPHCIYATSAASAASACRVTPATPPGLKESTPTNPPGTKVLGDVLEPDLGLDVGRVRPGHEARQSGSSTHVATSARPDGHGPGAIGHLDSRPQTGDALRFQDGGHAFRGTLLFVQCRLGRPK